MTTKLALVFVIFINLAVAEFHLTYSWTAPAGGQPGYFCIGIGTMDIKEWTVIEADPCEHAKNDEPCTEPEIAVEF